MERGSNLNIWSSWKGTLSHFAVCNNNAKCINFWVQLGTTLNHQGPRHMTQFSMALVIVGIYYLLYFNIFLNIWYVLLTVNWLKPGDSSTVHTYAQKMHRSTQWNGIHRTHINMKIHKYYHKNLF